MASQPSLLTVARPQFSFFKWIPVAALAALAAAAAKIGGIFEALVNTIIFFCFFL